MGQGRQGTIRTLVYVYTGIVFAWLAYRLVCRAPEWVDELVAKPILMLVPVVLVVLFSERTHVSSLGMSRKHIAGNIALGLTVGAALLAEKYLGQGWKGEILFTEMSRLGYTPLTALVVPLATALSEEIVYRGYFFTRLRLNGLSETVTILLSSVLFVGVHVPLALLVNHETPEVFAVYAAMLFVLSCILGFVYSRTKSLAAPVVIHWMWNASYFLR